MIWFTWRQFRTQTWITVGGLAVLAVLLLITARSIADAYDAANVAGCSNNCATAIENFLRDATNGTGGTVYDLVTPTMYMLPALIGIFWGAPLIARELETGTHRLAWNQSVTRTRWLATKLAIIGGASVATVGLLSWAITSWAHHIDDANGDRIKPLLYGARGVVPISYTLFAFVLGVTAGMLIRRTVPAMAATLAIYIGAVAAMPLWIRGHLTSPVHATPAFDLARLRGIGLSPNGTLRVYAEAPANAWVLSNHVVTNTGQVITANPQYCSPSASPEACRQWLGTLGLRQDLAYHPQSHFWSLQWAEAGIFLGIAVLLVGFCFWWIRRRVS
jgi:ABC-type transport system involved in multi-copper enzyme maturation permease subunit